MKTKGISRRNFLGKSAATAGIVTLGPISSAIAAENNKDQCERLPREVWIASISQMNMKALTSAEMVDQVIDSLNQITIYNPDIISLPEHFPWTGVKKEYTTHEKVAESKNALKRLSAFSKKNNCYSVCPVYTFENGKTYNAAVLFDRKGQKIGEYRKAHLTEGEIDDIGLTPGTLNPQVFHTDFGTIGIQICYDMFWDDTWTVLKDKGAEIVFFGAAFSGGQLVNGKAWQHRYMVVSSTCKSTAKICDITGEEVVQTGFWNPNHICAPVNMEKTFLHLWPNIKHVNEIQQKYGRKVRISIFHEADWIIIESLSSDVKVKDILREYNMRTYDEQIRDATIAQKKAREK